MSDTPASPALPVRSPAHQRTGGEALVAVLEALGVEIAFGLPGVHNLPAWQALSGSPIRLVGVRHEQTAVYAADGFARTTGGLGVALTTTGPGAANALGATGEAWASSSPVLVIATDIPTTLRRPGVYRGVLHETTDQGAMFAPVVKQVLRARTVDEIAPLTLEAARTAMASPRRPVYLEIPTDLLGAATTTELSADLDGSDAPALSAGRDLPAGTELPAGTRPSSVDAALEPVDPGAPDASALAEAVILLAHAERPLIWAGGGAIVAEAGPEIERLAARLGAPVIETYGARGLIGGDHPGKVRGLPHVPEVGRLWDEADVVVAIGSDFDGMMTQNWAMPAPARMITINVDAADAAKNYAPDIQLTVDARVGTAAVSGALEAYAVEQAPWADPAGDHEQLMDRLAREEPAAAGYLAAMRRVVDEQTVVFADMCIPGYWLAGFHPRTGARTLAYPVGWGTLGFAFPSSIGAALGQDAPVLCVCGDGGFLFACGELAVLAQEQVPLTVLIVDDGGYGMLRYDQRHAGDDNFGVDLTTPDFAALAAAFGVEAEQVDGFGPEFERALARQLASPRPTVLVTRASLDPPPSTSPRWYRRAGV